MNQVGTLKTPTGYTQQIAQVKASIEKANECTTPTDQDKVDIKGDSGLKKAGKFVLGAGIGTVLAPVYGLGNAMDRSVNAGLKGAGVSGPQETLGGKAKKVLIGFSMPAGLFVGLAVGGPLGAVAGLLVAPGVTGGLLETGKGVIEGAKDGFELANSAAQKVSSKLDNEIEKKVKASVIGGNHSAKSLARKMLAYDIGRDLVTGATYVATSLVTVPALAAFGSLTKGMSFALNAIGMNPEPKNTKEGVSNFGKHLVTSVAYLAGYLGTPGLLFAVPGGMATAGGVATFVTGVKEGAKGVARAYKDGMKVTGYTK